MIEHKLSGGPELIALMDLLPKRVRSNIGRGAVRAAAKPIQIEAKRLVRKRSRMLEKSIKVSSARVDSDVISVKVQTRGKGSFVAPWIEYGVRPHWIRVADEAVDEVDRRLKPTRSGRARARKTIMGRLNRMVREGSLVIKGQFVGPEVFHPGHGAFPFMRPALEAKRAEAVNAAGDYMRGRLSWNSLRAPQLEAETEEA